MSVPDLRSLKYAGDASTNDSSPLPRHEGYISEKIGTIVDAAKGIAKKLTSPAAPPPTTVLVPVMVPVPVEEVDVVVAGPMDPLLDMPQPPPSTPTPASISDRLMAQAVEATESTLQPSLATTLSTPGLAAAGHGTPHAPAFLMALKETVVGGVERIIDDAAVAESLHNGASKQSTTDVAAQLEDFKTEDHLFHGQQLGSHAAAPHVKGSMATIGGGNGSVAG